MISERINNWIEQRRKKRMDDYCHTICNMVLAKFMGRCSYKYIDRVGVYLTIKPVVGKVVLHFISYDLIQVVARYMYKGLTYETTMNEIGTKIIQSTSEFNKNMKRTGTHHKEHFDYPLREPVRRHRQLKIN